MRLARTAKGAYNRPMAKRVITRKRQEPPEKSEPAPAAPTHLKPSPISGHALPLSTLWPKGVSQNPGGAPRGKRITTWLAEFGEIPSKLWPVKDSPEWDALPGNAQIALSQLRRGMDQEDGLPAAMWAADRVEGGVDRTVHLTHKAEPTMSLEDAAEMVRQAKLLAPPGVEEEF